MTKFIEGSVFADHEERIEELEGAGSFSGSYNDLTDKPTIPTKTSDLTHDSGFADEATVNSALDGKVDKVSGKGLSENDFTTTLKNKLDALPDNTTLAAVLTAITNRLTALENWKADMPKKSKRFTGTTDANGDVTIDLTTGGFTSAPSIGVTYIFNNNNYGTHYNIKSLSATSIQLRVMRNKNTTVGALGGDVDPDEPLASTAVTIIASEF